MSYYKTPAACYHWCIVPLCNNTTIKTPQKAFIQVPLENSRRCVWIKASQRKPDEFSKDSIIFVCEDHFELQHGLENYIKGNSVKTNDMVVKSRIQNKFDLPSCSRKSFSFLQFTPKHTKKKFLQVVANNNVVKCDSYQDPGGYSNESTQVPEDDAQIPELNKQGRITVYDKIHVYFFCEKVLQKMRRHLSMVHFEEPSVAKLLAQKGGSAGLYGPCSQCLGFFIKKTLWKHVKSCKQRAPCKEYKRGSSIYSSAFIASYANAVWGPRFDAVVSPGLGDDEVGQVCRSDKLLREYGIFVYRNIGHDQISRVKKKMRVLGSLVAEARRYRHNPDLSLSELILPDNFDLFIRCVRSMTDNTSDPRLKKCTKELGSAIRICLLILHGTDFKPDFLREDADLRYSNRLFDRD